MARKNRVEQLLDRHYHDMLSLNRDFIQTLNRPRGVLPNTQSLDVPRRHKLTKKQLDALARGRKKLASNRAKVIQI